VQIGVQYLNGATHATEELQRNEVKKAKRAIALDVMCDFLFRSFSQSRNFSWDAKEKGCLSEHAFGAHPISVK
jgi:hypothetical protein